MKKRKPQGTGQMKSFYGQGLQSGYMNSTGSSRQSFQSSTYKGNQKAQNPNPIGNANAGEPSRNGYSG